MVFRSELEEEFYTDFFDAVDGFSYMTAMHVLTFCAATNEPRENSAMLLCFRAVNAVRSNIVKHDNNFLQAIPQLVLTGQRDDVGDNFKFGALSMVGDLIVAIGARSADATVKALCLKMQTDFGNALTKVVGTKKQAQQGKKMPDGTFLTSKNEIVKQRMDANTLSLEDLLNAIEGEEQFLFDYVTEMIQSVLSRRSTGTRIGNVSLNTSTQY
jgi:hypothetical protein